MNLYILKITIEKEGKITESYDFRKGLSVVKNSSDLYDAVAFISGKRKAEPISYEVRFVAEVEADKKYYINAVKKKNSEKWKATVYTDNGLRECTEEYFELVTTHREMDSLNFYREKTQNYITRICQYKNILDYYPEGEFAKRTEGMGTTRSFRGFICQYIRNFKPIRINDKKDIFLKALPSGTFRAAYMDKEDKPCLSESEKTVFNYLCFLSLADFWSRCEKIRNLHCIDRPLVVAELTNRIYEDYNIDFLLRKTDSLDRQTVLFVPEYYKPTIYDIEKST